MLVAQSHNSSGLPIKKKIVTGERFDGLFFCDYFHKWSNVSEIEVKLKDGSYVTIRRKK